jgi:hypothetical protein
MLEPHPAKILKLSKVILTVSLSLHSFPVFNDHFKTYSPGSVTNNLVCGLNLLLIIAFPAPETILQFPVNSLLFSALKNVVSEQLKKSSPA